MSKIIICTFSCFIFCCFQLRAQTYPINAGVYTPPSTACPTGPSRCCTPNTVYIGVSGVDIDAEHTGQSVTDNDVTDGSGNFDVDLPIGIIGMKPSIPAPVSHSDWAYGVSTFDLILLNKHIDLVQPIDCPLARLGLDVENDGDLDTFDYAVIRTLILSLSSSFTEVPYWRFVPKAYTHPGPSHPAPAFVADFWNTAYANSLGVEYPFCAQFTFNGKTYTYNGVNSWMEEMHEWPFDPNAPCGSGEFGFYIVKSGDANNSAGTGSFFTSDDIPVNALNAPDSETTTTLSLDGIRLIHESNLDVNATSDPAALLSDTRYKITVKAHGPQRLDGYQMGLSVNPGLLNIIELRSELTEPGQTSEGSFNRLPEFLAQGQVRTLWVNNFLSNPQGANISGPPRPLFSVIVEPLSDLPIPNILNHVFLNDALLRNEFYGNNAILNNVQVSIDVEILPLVTTD